MCLPGYSPPAFEYHGVVGRGFRRRTGPGSVATLRQTSKLTRQVVHVVIENIAISIALPLPQEPEVIPTKRFDPSVSLSLPSRIAIIGNYLPRHCGIATFTTDFCDAVSTEFGTERLFALPVNDPDSEYNYSERVRFELTEEELAFYGRAARSDPTTIKVGCR